MAISTVITLWGLQIRVEQSNLRLPSNPVALCNWNPTAREIKSRGEKQKKGGKGREISPSGTV